MRINYIATKQICFHKYIPHSQLLKPVYKKQLKVFNIFTK